MYFFIKTLIAALIIATVTMLSERNPLGAALLKSLPLTSLLVFLFMKYEGRTNQEISKMSWDILWLVFPSLILFIVFPIFLDKGYGFGTSLLVASIIMVAGYGIVLKTIS